MPQDSVLRVRGIPKLASSESPSESLYLLEQPPAYHLIHRGKGGYYVPLPWIYYYMRSPMDVYRVSRLLVSPVRIRSQNDCLYYSLLPNLAGAQFPCYSHQYWPHRTESVFFGIACSLQDWWDAQSNNDYWDDMLYINRDLCEALVGHDLIGSGADHAKMLRAWEKLSLEEMVTLPWKPAGKVKDGVLGLRLVNRPFVNNKSLGL